MQQAVNFTDLVVWQKAHNLVLAVYACTKSFPKEEIFSLTDQIRRASISITSNIAEGHGRLSNKEKIRFYITARGSLVEVQNQLIAARDIEYLNEEDFSEIYQKTIETVRLLNGVIRSMRARE